MMASRRWKDKEGSRVSRNFLLRLTPIKEAVGSSVDCFLVAGAYCEWCVSNHEKLLKAISRTGMVDRVTARLKELYAYEISRQWRSKERRETQSVDVPCPQNRISDSLLKIDDKGKGDSIHRMQRSAAGQENDRCATSLNGVEAERPNLMPVGIKLGERESCSGLILPRKIEGLKSAFTLVKTVLCRQFLGVFPVKDRKKMGSYTQIFEQETTHKRIVRAVPNRVLM